MIMKEIFIYLRWKLIFIFFNPNPLNFYVHEIDNLDGGKMDVIEGFVSHIAAIDRSQTMIGGSFVKWGCLKFGVCVL